MSRPSSLFVAVLLCLATCCPADESPTIDLVFWDEAHIQKIKGGWRDDTGHVETALKGLRRLADKAARNAIYSVVNHGPTPPSGDPHDYQSYGPYWWPNPDTPDGLPYIRKDGIVNEAQTATGDNAPLRSMIETVRCLSLAGYLLDEPRYSARSAQQLRGWFLDEATRMNPHLTFGQAIPGRVEGRCIGIIDTRKLVHVAEYAKLLKASGAWGIDDEQALKQWLRDYLEWLTTSKIGKEEGTRRNNHGTFYDVQVVGLALYLGQHELARQTLEECRASRFEAQIQPDGSQPEELSRTRSLTYSVFNLSGFCTLARYGDSLGIDLWRHERNGRGSLEKAARFVAPALMGDQPWRYPQLAEKQLSQKNTPNRSAIFCLLAKKYGDPRFVRLLKTDAGQFSAEDTAPLVFPFQP